MLTVRGLAGYDSVPSQAVSRVLNRVLFQTRCLDSWDHWWEWVVGRFRNEAFRRPSPFALTSAERPEN